MKRSRNLVSKLARRVNEKISGWADHYAKSDPVLLAGTMSRE
jgi:hypothetical protein